jgi:hypothetical protein
MVHRYTSSDGDRQKRRTKGANEHHQSDGRGIHKWQLMSSARDSPTVSVFWLQPVNAAATTTTPSVDLIRFLI